MAEILGAAWATPGLLSLILAFLAAGLVRGFTGFGTALIVMPVATRVVPPAEAILVVMVAGMLSWGAIVPRAWREADRREVGLLTLGAVLAAPLGVALLSVLDPVPVRWVVSVAAAVTLVALISGWRYHGRVAWPGLAGIGGAAGVLGGVTGLTGPPVILFYLSGPGRAAEVRANTILFLALLDIGIFANLFLRDMVSARAVGLAAILAVPYVLTILIGQRLFRPELERFYRGAAYAIIGLAVVTGLPLFDA